MLEWKCLPLNHLYGNKGFRADLSGLSGGMRSFIGLLEEYRDLLAVGDGNLGNTHLLEHTIDTGSGTPVK